MRKSKQTKSNAVFSWVIWPLVLLVLITVCYFIFNKNNFRLTNHIRYVKQEFLHLDNFEVHGVDISRHNGELNWAEISKHTINDWELKFVFIRATVALADGNLKVDNNFLENWSQASNNSLIRGAYHFYSPAVDVDEQAKLFITEVSLKKGDLPPVLDVENFEKGRVFITQNDIPKVEKWLHLVEKHYAVKPIIYTSKKMYLDYFRNKKFENYHFWIANYSNQILSLDKKDWSFWQHSELGKINSHKCSFDLNVFNGTEEDLEKICIH